MEKPINPNYCATVVELKDFVILPNCDNVKGAIIYGNQVIVSKDTPAGAVGLYFPVETALSTEFMHHNNLHRDKSLNRDQTKAGFFEANGRVRAMKFRGNKSAGFWIPLSALGYVAEEHENDWLAQSLAVGDDFDRIGDHVICFKYDSPQNNKRLPLNARPRNRRRTLAARVAGQFNFHEDTKQFRRNLHMLELDDYISITDKWHGTSAVYANILVERELKWYEKLAIKLGIPVNTHEYDFVWSSRRVLKGVGQTRAEGKDFYDTDIWTEVANEIREAVPEGFSVYGEIVGYAGSKPIQKGYTYGCQPGTHRFLVYRVTQTNAAGLQTELSWPQIKQFCRAFGLEHVKELYYGTVFYYANEYGGDDWHDKFIKKLDETVQGRECGYNPGMPAEGVVVRIDGLVAFMGYKHKSFEFLEHETKELDAGVENIEDSQESISDD